MARTIKSPRRGCLAGASFIELRNGRAPVGVTPPTPASASARARGRTLGKPPGCPISGWFPRGGGGGSAHHRDPVGSGRPPKESRRAAPQCPKGKSPQGRTAERRWQGGGSARKALVGSKRWFWKLSANTNLLISHFMSILYIYPRAQ